MILRRPHHSPTTTTPFLGITQHSHSTTLSPSAVILLVMTDEQNHPASTTPRMALIRFYGSAPHSLQLPRRWRRRRQRWSQLATAQTIKPEAIKYPFHQQWSITSLGSELLLILSIHCLRLLLLVPNIGIVLLVAIVIVDCRLVVSTTTSNEINRERHNHHEPQRRRCRRQCNDTWRQ